MSVRVGINGFGRIGKGFLRAAAAQGADLDIVAVNDLTSPEVHAHLLKYDSTMGTYAEEVRADGDALIVAGHRIQVLAQRDPADLPWADLGVDVVVESTGKFTDRDAAALHLAAGARRVVISAPADGADRTIVMGVNDDTFDPTTDFVLSNASCTTNCFVPMVKVLDDAFTVTSGLMTTVHAYTSDQSLVDFPHKDLRRARAAAINIIPTSTGAARATGLVLQSLAGRLDGVSLRVPVATGSITDFTAVVSGNPSVEAVNEAFAIAADGPLKGILVYTEAPIVSSDVVGSPASCTFDAGLTMVQRIDDATSLAKVLGWYDNEWGYSNRLVDLVRLVGGR
ncbi:MAG TPA: type I glyceraldehyde-3-phosphate dehydrogenase [Acidimicrobiales bacterium]|jgi:glyceraldehyde 3-phosphate dehydrogenase